MIILLFVDYLVKSCIKKLSTIFKKKECEPLTN